MSSDMTKDVFADTPYGKAALRKLGRRISPIPKNFRLYAAGWLDDGYQVMSVDGAVFRKAKRGPHKGKLSVLIPGTKLRVYVTAEEIATEKEKNDECPCGL